MNQAAPKSQVIRMYAAREEIIRAHRYVFAQQNLDAGIRLQTIRRDEFWIGAKD